jgi:hypothetical protein
MLYCDVKGCGAWVSEIFSPREYKRWLVVTAAEWPNLDWWAIGGVDKLTLCPRCRAGVGDLIVLERALDPSMNPEKPDSGNRS